MPIVPIAAVSMCNYPWDNLTKLTFPFATMAFDDSLPFFHTVRTMKMSTMKCNDEIIIIIIGIVHRIIGLITLA